MMYLSVYNGKRKIVYIVLVTTIMCRCIAMSTLSVEYNFSTTASTYHWDFTSSTFSNNITFDNFTDANMLECFNCHGDKDGCGIRTPFDRTVLCNYEYKGHSCGTYITFEDGEIEYNRGCHPIVCPLSWQNDFVCSTDREKTCAKCCLTSLCNFEEYTPHSSSSFLQVPFVIEILHKIYHLAFIFYSKTME